MPERLRCNCCQGEFAMPYDEDDIGHATEGIAIWLKHLPQGAIGRADAKVRLALLQDIRANVDEAAADLEKIMKKTSE